MRDMLKTVAALLIAIVLAIGAIILLPFLAFVANPLAWVIIAAIYLLLKHFG